MLGRMAVPLSNLLKDGLISGTVKETYRSITDPSNISAYINLALKFKIRSAIKHTHKPSKLTHHVSHCKLASIGKLHPAEAP